MNLKRSRRAVPYVAPDVWPNKDGWQPTERELRSIHLRAQSQGLFCSWALVMVLESGNLIIQERVGEGGRSMMAKRRGAKWVFCLVDSEEPIFAGDRKQD